MLPGQAGWNWASSIVQTALTTFTSSPAKKGTGIHLKFLQVSFFLFVVPQDTTWLKKISQWHWAMPGTRFTGPSLSFLRTLERLIESPILVWVMWWDDVSNEMNGQAFYQALQSYSKHLFVAVRTLDHCVYIIYYMHACILYSVCIKCKVLVFFEAYMLGRFLKIYQINWVDCNLFKRFTSNRGLWTPRSLLIISS